MDTPHDQLHPFTYLPNMAHSVEMTEPSWTSTPLVQDSRRRGQEPRVSVATRIMEAQDTTAPNSPAAHQSTWPPQHQASSPGATTATSSNQNITSESQVWQCMDRLSFIVSEMTKKEDKTTTWKPSSSMAPEPATASMGLTEFRVWARSVMDYGRACKWPREQEAMSVRLLCDESIKKAIDARVKQCDWERLSARDAIGVVQSVVTGPRFEVGAWNDFFKYAQESQDNISEYVVTTSTCWPVP